MPLIEIFRSVTGDSVRMYWTLLKITVPVILVTRLASDLGAVEALAPATAPVMSALGLPPELGFAWVTGLLVGVWGGSVALFAVVPIERLTTADVTVFTALILFAHALPIEQRIVQKTGAGFFATSALRLVGGLLYALLLGWLFDATGWLSEPVSPHWAPATTDPSLAAFAWSTAAAMASMLAIIVALVAALKLAGAIGLTARLTALLAPLLGRAGVGAAAAPTTIVGLTLGLSYGGALIIEEARKGRIAERDLFLATVFMGFAHSMIEDTALALALGADFTSVFFGRLAFSFAATALVAVVVAGMSDRVFFRFLFTRRNEVCEAERREARSTL